MLPAGFAAAVGVDIGVLSSLAGEAGTLRSMLEIAGGAGSPQGAYFKFAALARRASPGLAWSSISDIYRAAKYFSNPGKFLSEYDKDVIMDRRLASVVGTPTGLGPAGEPIRYGVTVTVVFPGTGDTRQFGLWLASDEFRSPADVIDRAIAEIMGQFRPRSRFADYGGESENGFATATIDQFQMFTKEGVS